MDALEMLDYVEDLKKQVEEAGAAGTFAIMDRKRRASRNENAFQRALNSRERKLLKVCAKLKAIANGDCTMDKKLMRQR